jgi:hypothetical protein
MSPSRWAVRALRCAPMLALGFAFVASPVQAQAPGSTGVDGSWMVSWERVIGSGGSEDFFTAVVVATPPSVWEPNTLSYQWIGANESATLEPNTGDNAPNYLYTFRNVFDVSTSDALGLSIVFRCARDNSLVSYSLNGVEHVGDCGTNFKFGSSQFLTGFLPGENTLDFNVTGDGLTDGLLVSIDQVSVAPEPASMGLMATGLIGLFGIARRKRGQAPQA